MSPKQTCSDGLGQPHLELSLRQTFQNRLHRLCIDLPAQQGFGSVSMVQRQVVHPTFLSMAHTPTTIRFGFVVAARRFGWATAMPPALDMLEVDPRRGCDDITLAVSDGGGMSSLEASRGGLTTSIATRQRKGLLAGCWGVRNPAFTG